MCILCPHPNPLPEGEGIYLFFLVDLAEAGELLGDGIGGGAAVLAGALLGDRAVLHGATRADDAVVRHAFEYCENIYMSATWWDTLDDAKKTALRWRSTEAADVTVERKNNCLMYDGNNYVNWTVTARESNLRL